METIAVYTGDSANFHIFQIVDENLVGSIYVKKEETSDIPEGVEVNLITHGRDEELWKIKVKELLGKARPGSKAELKLKKVLVQYGAE